jgi:hypothetical protein
MPVYFSFPLLSSKIFKPAFLYTIRFLLFAHLYSLFSAVRASYYFIRVRVIDSILMSQFFTRCCRPQCGESVLRSAYS